MTVRLLGDDVLDEGDPRHSGCLCQRCAWRYRVDFMLSDELWAKIHGPFNLLCEACIVELIEARKEFDYLDLVKLDAPTNQITRY